MGGAAPITKNFRGADLDPLTYDAVVELAAISGDLYINPIDGYGSYRSNKASGGTDTGGGHCDINAEGWTDAQARYVETLARSIGFVAYFRPRYSPYTGNAYGWQRHIHLIRRDCVDLSEQARWQVDEYDAGRDGLAVPHKDTGSRAYVGMTWAKYLANKKTTQETLMALTSEQMDALVERIWLYPIKNRVTGKSWSARSYVEGGSIWAAEAKRDSAATLALVRTIATKVGVDVDEKAIAASVVEALADDVRAAVAAAVEAGSADGDAPDAKTIADAVVDALGSRLGGDAA